MYGKRLEAYRVCLYHMYVSNVQHAFNKVSYEWLLNGMIFLIETKFIVPHALICRIIEVFTCT